MKNSLPSLISPVWVSSRIEQHLDDGRIPIAACGVVKRSFAFLILGIQLGPRVQQGSQNFATPILLSCFVQRCPAVFILLVRIVAGLQEHLHDHWVAIVRRPIKQRVAMFIARSKAKTCVGKHLNNG